MPDFGLTEALAKALEVSKAVEVMRPGERQLAAQAAKVAPKGAAPVVPATQAPSVQVAPATPRPGAVQAPPLNPSVPPADIPPADAQAAAGAPTDAPAPPTAAASASAAAPPSAVPATSEPAPQAAQPAAAPGAVAPANTLPARPPLWQTPESGGYWGTQDLSQTAARFVTANLGDFPPERLNMSHMPNVDTMSSPDGVKAAILQVADDNKDAITAARRGTITDEQLTGLAQDLAINGDVLKQVLTREFGESLQRPEVVLAARMVEQHQVGTLFGLAGKVADGTATSDEVVAFERQKQTFDQYRAQLSGVAAETGRSTRAFGIPVGLPPEVMDHVASVIRQNNPDMQKVAQAIRLAGLPSGIADIINGTHSIYGRAGIYGLGLLPRIFINGILSGPPTWAKIFVGNNFNVLKTQADLFTAGIGRELYGLAARLGGFPTSDEGVRLSDAMAHMHGVISAGADALRIAGRVLKTGVSMDNVMRFDPAELAGVRNVDPKLGVGNSLLPEIRDSYFGSIVRGIDLVIDAPGSRAIASIDDSTKTLGYRGYLTMMTMKEIRARLTAGTLRPGDVEQVTRDLMAHPTPEMEQAAEAWGHRMTFQTPFPPGGPGEGFSNFINSKAPALKFIFPFMRTATNIFKQSVGEASLFGQFSSRMRAQIAAGGFEGDLAKARLANGTAIAAMFAWMAVHDRTTGDAPKDSKERMAWGLDGRIPNAIRFSDPLGHAPDTWRSIAWFEPFATIASTTADIVKLRAYLDGYGEANSMMPHEQMLDDAAAHVAASIIENTGSKTFMQGAAQFSEMYNDPQRGFAMWAQQLGANMVPYSGMLKFIRNEQDPYMRQAFSLIDKVRDELPTVMGVKGSQTLPARLDVFGDARPHYYGNSILGPLNPLPGLQSKKDDVTDEIQDLMEKTRTVFITMPSHQLSLLGSGKGLQDGQGMRLTPEEYNDYVLKSRAAKIFDGGTLTFRDKIAQTLQSPVYQGMSPAARVEQLGLLQRQADKAGRIALWHDNQDFRERMIAWSKDMNRLKYNQ